MVEPKKSLSPILVTGAHRSGTTWVGKMLAANRRVAYISEPLNVFHRPGVFSAPVSHWYTMLRVWGGLPEDIENKQPVVIATGCLFGAIWVSRTLRRSYRASIAA